jgi:hypothetical protein
MATDSVQPNGDYTIRKTGEPAEASRLHWVGGNMRRYAPSPPGRTAPPSPVELAPGDEGFPLPRAVSPAPVVLAPGDEGFPLPQARQPVPPAPVPPAPAVPEPDDEQFSPLAQPLPLTRRRNRQWFRAAIAVALFGVANSTMLFPSSAANEIAMPGNDLAAVASLYVITDSQRGGMETQDGGQPDDPVAAA